MDNQVVRILTALCREVGSPRALAVMKLAHAGEWAELQKLRVRPQDYQDSESYWRDSLVTELMRKCDLDTGVDREAAAVRTFWACEARNATTNVRLQRYMPETLFLEDHTDLAVSRFISEWRKEMQQVLGNLPDTLTPRFSGGATYADTGKLTTTPDKMSSTPTITSSARCLLPLWRQTAWARCLITRRPWKSDPLTVRGNVFFTVPKDGQTFRGCCKEASLNVSYQLDAGRQMRVRLRRIGIDLKTGQASHKILAQWASRDGQAATIDMSNASDTMCRVLPKLVLSQDWWELLDSLRASHTLMGKNWVRLEKFSSMGNGFTFELETLLFATLARTVVRLNGLEPAMVSCYGDDLIVPTECYRDVTSALRFFGFEPNMRKTFGEGPFRESCGGDYFNGVSVRAHYIEELPDEPQKWISLANGLRRVALASPQHPQRWDVVRRAWMMCLDQIPSAIRRCRGPEYLGDIVIHDRRENWGFVASVPDHDPTWEVRWIKTWQPIPEVLLWDHWSPAVQLASCTLGLPSSGVTPRDGISGWRFGVNPVGGDSTQSPSASRLIGG